MIKMNLFSEKKKIYFMLFFELDCDVVLGRFLNGMFAKRCVSGGEIILPDISIPQNDKLLQHQFTLKRNNAKFNSADSYETDFKVAVESLAGTAKSDQTIFENLQRIIIKKYFTSNPELPEDYMHFGNNDFVSNLEALVKSNPFYASTLSSKSNESKANLCINAIATSQDTWFSRIIDSLDFQYPRVNIEFDHNLKVKQYSVYRIQNGEKKDITLEIIVNQAYVFMIVLISFYAQIMNTVIHIYTYLLTSAFNFLFLPNILVQDTIVLLQDDVTATS